jgi:peptidoglycan/xylan/chitin deacetylase (PgdA/CDA1 family)
MSAMIKQNLSIIPFCFLFLSTFAQTKSFTSSHGAIVRGDSSKKEIALVFTGDEFGDGLTTIIKTLQKQHVHASFFFTGRFYDNASFQNSLKQLYKNGNYLSLHSNGHLLYCDWNNRDSLLVTQDSFATDLKKNMEAIKALGIDIPLHKYFIPPYEWWNDAVATWSKMEGWQLINYTPGITTGADYTYPEMTSYKSSDTLIQLLKQFETNNYSGLNGTVILIHAGTDPRRTDKLYTRLDEIIIYLKAKGYNFKRVDELFEK